MQIAIGQINSTVGAFESNRAKLLEFTVCAREAGADMVVFPEMALCGYPPMDLLDHASFVEANLGALRALQRELPHGIAVVVGYVDRSSGAAGRALANVAAVLLDGRVVHRQAKRLLPTYDVFDEARYFEPAPTSTVWRYRNRTFGIAICEDIWWETEPVAGTRYPHDPVRDLLDAGADCIIAPSASPFHSGKLGVRQRLVASIGRSGGVPVVYVNTVGANDSLVFDGYSFATSANGGLIAQCPGFEEALAIADVAADGATAGPHDEDAAAPSPHGEDAAAPSPHGEDAAAIGDEAQGEPTRAVGRVVPPQIQAAVAPAPSRTASPLGQMTPPLARMADTHHEPTRAVGRVVPPSQARMADIEAALVLGIRDYLAKTGFKRVHLGLSGGIDSAVVTVLAVKAVGPENVKVFLMPSRYSSTGSLTDSEQLVANVGIASATISIEPAFGAFTEMLAGEFAGAAPDLTEENIQARVRGVLMMAYSNKFGSLTLTTGNKSELAVGYCTMYGDMAGGLAVIGDLFKTEVYELAEFINREQELIPRAIITKAPSAELRPDQKDQDSLPPYEILDAVLERYLLANRTFQQIVAEGFESDVVSRVLKLVGASEYKRRQAPPVIKVSPRAFGTGRRMPIARRIYEHRV